MAITTPYSLELRADQDAKDTVAGTVSDTVAQKMKVYLGGTTPIPLGNVPAHKRQAYIGTLKAAFAFLKTKVGSNTTAGTKVVYGNWDAGSSGNFTLAAGTSGITAGDVAIIVAGNFPFHRSGLSDETFKQLINVLLEKTKGN